MTAPAGATSTAVVKAPKEAPVVLVLSTDHAKARIAPFLPEGVSIDRVIASAQLAALANPAIAKCTDQSIVLAVARIQSWGLEIGQTAHLVPYNTKVKLPDGKYEWQQVCTPIADYKGLIELMVGSGCIRHAEGHAVFEGDLFDYELGLAPTLTHKRSSYKGRGKVVAAYVILHLAGGRKAFDVMDIGEIDAIRNEHSKQWTQEKVGDCPAWWAVKCVVRRISKTVPKNPRLARVMAVIDEDARAERGEEVASIEAPTGTLIGPGEERGAPSDPAPDMPLCAACHETRVEGEGMVCDGCEGEAEAYAKQKATEHGGELPLGDAPKAKGTDAVKAGR